MPIRLPAHRKHEYARYRRAKKIDKILGHGVSEEEPLVPASFPEYEDDDDAEDLSAWERITQYAHYEGYLYGEALARKYIKAIEHDWGGGPSTAEDLKVACDWIEKVALHDAYKQPWDALKKLREMEYPTDTKEGRLLVGKMVDASKIGIVEGVRALLGAYGCRKLRFADMDAFFTYFTSAKKFP